MFEGAPSKTRSLVQLHLFPSSSSAKYGLTISGTSFILRCNARATLSMGSMHLSRWQCISPAQSNRGTTKQCYYVVMNGLCITSLPPKKASVSQLTGLSCETNSRFMLHRTWCKCSCFLADEFACFIYLLRSRKSEVNPQAAFLSSRLSLKIVLTHRDGLCSIHCGLQAPVCLDRSLEYGYSTVFVMFKHHIFLFLCALSFPGSLCRSSILSVIRSLSA